MVYQRKPGLLLVGPRLHDPTPENAATFLRWTNLHLRDLLNIPEDPQLGRLTRSFRFTAPENDSKYSHDESKGYTPYFYTSIVDDIGVLQGQAYYDVSRSLDLEKTRELAEGEEAVGYGKEGAMVWNVVSAKFAVFTEVESGKLLVFRIDL
ncbi:hypothetical protein BKA66DRAFT_165275 [Pyrenochaeta sp. MPI-SDFR-AT-0127]|nr:hypothetical protein BKA66DRAFT_165275 [Pyrenochaeta sp. MPI-SDFR-AT-0127]